MSPTHTIRISCISLCLLLVACNQEDAGSTDVAVEFADHVFLNGGVYTVNPEQPWAEAVALSGNAIMTVGDNADIQSLVGPETTVTDLSGKMLLPGFSDTHMHVLYGGDVFSSCLLDWETDPGEITRIIEACAQKPRTNEDGWIYATRWARWSFKEERPPADFMDEILSDRPILIEASDGHSLWANRKAMELAGISRDTPDPPGGRIERDALTGTANGMMHESAMRLIVAAMPESSMEQKLGWIQTATDFAASLGVTSAIDPGVNLDQARVFTEYDQTRGINMRLLLALTPIGFEIAAFDDDIYRTVARRSEVETERIKAHSVKVFADGVIENMTSPLLEPYIVEGAKPLEPFYAPEHLADYFINLDQQGINIHVHAIGDVGIRMTLDAFQAMREANGMSDNRHLIAHVQLVDPEDLPRFAELKIIASFSTLWAYPDEYNLDVYPDMLGHERIERFYPVGSIAATGGDVVIGSDWTVTELNPFFALEVAVTRTDPHTNSGPALNSAEAISLAQALEAYTAKAAWAMNLESMIGTIETGKRADLAVIDRNLFEIPPQQISEAQVLMTLFDGNVIYQKQEDQQHEKD